MTGRSDFVTGHEDCGILPRKVKCIRASGKGVEEHFDLDADPCECLDLAEQSESDQLLQLWRPRMVETLEGREEGLVRDGELVPGAPVTTMLQHVRDRLAAAPS